MIAWGWCPKHYTRWKKWGDPTFNPNEMTLAERLAARTPVGLLPDECWPWQGKLSRGYGRVTFEGRNHPAHRVAYELAHGALPPTLHVDHMCHNRDPDCNDGEACAHRRCVNPAHLRAVTVQVNVTEGHTVVAVNAAKTHCVHGHLFDEANTRITRTGSRHCRTCHRIAEQQRRKALSARD